MVINGMGKHFYPAIVTITAGLLTTLIIIPIAHFTHSITMINLGVILPMCIAWGVLMPVYCCKILDISKKRYFTEGIFKPILTSSIGALIFRFVIEIFYPKNWITLFAEIIFFCLILFILFVVFVLKKNDRLYVSTLFSLKNPSI